MPVSSLLLHLPREEERARALLEELAARPEFWVGPSEGRRAALVLDTPSEEANRRAWRWLRDHPAAVHVDVLAIHFEDAEAER